jgi:WD40 repeat protein
VRSMSLIGAPSDPARFLVGCASGTIYACTISQSGSVSASVIQEGHTSPITALAFDTTTDPFSGPQGSATNSHYFVTGTSSGELRGWDLVNYRCVGMSTNPKLVSVLSLAFMNHSAVICGLEDGSVRCVEFPGLRSPLWSIATAHRGGTTTIGLTISATVTYLVTGGNDSTVRVWKLNNRELITQYSDHKKVFSSYPAIAKYLYFTFFSYAGRDKGVSRREESQPSSQLWFRWGCCVLRPQDE